MGFGRSAELLKRSSRFVPGGVWGHYRFPALLHPGCFPYFAKSGSGARFIDADDNEYIDFLCAWGSMVNGYCHPDIDRASANAYASGANLNHMTETSIDLAEYVCSTVKGADWCAFGKSGSDATATAVLVARAATSKSRIICSRGAFHGSHFWCNWCNPGEGRPVTDSVDIPFLFDWNDMGQLERLLDENGKDVAAILMTPFHHPIPGRAEMANPDMWQRVSELAQKHGVLLILDDVRAGFRLSVAGSHDVFGIEPDLVCFSKALGNTHALSLVTGKSALRGAADSVFISGTFWGASPAMAAALVNLKLLAEQDGPGKMKHLGEMLREGLLSLASSASIAMEVTGPAACPTVTIDGDDDYRLMTVFASEMVKRGIYVHPSHNWFVSAAHEEPDIEKLLEAAKPALLEVQKAS